MFSELNNLSDITLSKKYSRVCGIGIEDLDEYFGERIKALSASGDFDNADGLRSEILAWYDGYSWDGKNRVINPFSLLSFFNEERFESFWYASGTPKFLMELLKEDPGVYTNLKNLKITGLMLDTTEIGKIEAELLLFQAGYLTVKDVLPAKADSLYVLDTPNFEVKEAFDLHVATAWGR